MRVVEVSPPSMQNLPSPEYLEFVGRAGYIDDIEAKLKARHFVVSIDGIGGVGKTALAHQVATRCQAGHQFDAVIWISAKSRKLVLTGIDDIVPSLTSYDGLLNTIAQVLGFPGLVELSSDEKEKEVYKLISTIKCLLVIDNLETVEDQKIYNFLKELPEPTKALITSRKRLGEVERIVHLDAMTPEETKRLIELEAKAKKVQTLIGTAENTISRLHQATGGIPLAIIWVVGLIASGYSIEDVLRLIRAADSPLLEFCFRETFNKVLSDDSRMLLSIMPIFEEAPTRPQLSAATRFTGERLDLAINHLVTLSLINERTREEVDGTATKTFGILPLTLSFAQAELSKNRGLEKEARKALGEYLQLHATMKDAALQYGYTLEDLGATTERGRAAALLANLAFAAYQRGSYTDALSLYRRAVDTNPRLSYTYQLWAMVERQEGNFGRADELFREALRLNPHNPIILRAWSSMKSETGAVEEARKLAQQGVDENPQDKASLHALAVSESRARNFEKAEELFKRCLILNPVNYQEIRQNLYTYGARAVNFRRWGASMENSVKLDEARTLYENGLQTLREGLRVSTTDWKLHEAQILINKNLGELHLKMGDLDKSGEYLQRAFFLHPSSDWQLRHNSDIYMALARLERELGNSDKALELCEIGLRDWPGNHELRDLLGDLTKAKKRKRG